MAARKKENTPDNKAKENPITETGVKVGKALARSSHKVENTGRRARKVAENIITTVSRSAKTAKPAFQPPEGMSTEGQLGFLAGDIYRYLSEKGAGSPEVVLKAIMRRSNTQAMAYAALGWLVREGKVAFSPDGALISLRE